MYHVGDKPVLMQAPQAYQYDPYYGGLMYNPAMVSKLILSHSS